MKSIFRKSIFAVLIAFMGFAQNSFAQARLKLVWMGIEAALKSSEKDFDGLGTTLAKELKFSKISGFADKDLGAMFESIRLAATSAGGKDVKTLDDFVAAMAADPQLKSVVDHVLAKVNDSATELSKADLQALDSAALSNIVSDTAKARAPKLEIGASDIIPCSDCGITEAMRVRGVTIYLRRASDAEKRAFKSVVADKDIAKSTRVALGRVAQADGKPRLNLTFSAAGQKSFESLNRQDQAFVLQVAKDASGALDTETQELARSLVMFSRDGEGTVDLAADGGLDVLYVHMAEGNNRAAMRKMLDDANQAFPEAGRLTERRMKFCQEFRAAANATAAGQASMRAIDQEGCFRGIFKICK